MAASWSTPEFLFAGDWKRSEEHTSELQSHSDLVCRLLLEKKKNRRYSYHVVGSIDSLGTVDISPSHLTIAGTLPRTMAPITGQNYKFWLSGHRQLQRTWM